MNKLCPQCSMVYTDTSRARCLADDTPLVHVLTGFEIADRYQVRGLIGTGANDATVWSGLDTLTGEAVALKILPAGDETVVGRFSRGAAIAKALTHPHIAAVRADGRFDDGAVYLVMDLLHGDTVEATLRRGAMPADRALDVVAQVLSALEHAHAEGAVHRDIKPDNLFLVATDDDAVFAKILDFGIAKQPAKDGFDTSRSPRLSQDADICGTPYYMAPEQIAGGDVDGRTDLYSLGVVMYRLLTGRLPFQARNRMDIFHRHLFVPPPPFEQVARGVAVPAAVEAVVMRALKKAPDDRFQSATDMHSALVSARQVASREGAHAKPVDSVISAGLAASAFPMTAILPAVPLPVLATPPRRGKRWLWGLAVVLLLASAGAAIALWSSDTDTPVPDAERTTLRIDGTLEVTPVATRPTVAERRIKER